LLHNDTQLISGSRDVDTIDGTLIMWDLITGTTIQTLKGHSWNVSCCAVFDNETMVISGQADGTLIVWDLFTGMTIQTLKGSQVMFLPAHFLTRTKR
jgi:WD40 repeat protein